MFPPILLFLLQFLLPNCLANGQKRLTGAITFAFEADPTVWRITVHCPDCENDGLFHAETAPDGANIAKFSVDLKPKWQLCEGGKVYNEIKKLEVKAESVGFQAHQKRTNTWIIDSADPIDFGLNYLFQFGHYLPSMTARQRPLYLTMKFTKALEEPRSAGEGQPLLDEYLVEVKDKKAGITFGKKTLGDASEWRGEKEFEVPLGEGNFGDYFKTKPMPSVNVILTKIPKCSKCHQHEMAGSNVLRKEKANQQFIHTACHPKIGAEKYTKNKHRNKNNCKCQGCWPTKYFEGEEKKVEEKFRVLVPMPILQNGDQPLYMYEIDPTNAGSQLNNFGRPLTPPPAPAPPPPAPAEAAAPSSSGGNDELNLEALRAVLDDPSEIDHQDAYWQVFEAEKKAKEERREAEAKAKAEADSAAAANAPVAQPMPIDPFFADLDNRLRQFSEHFGEGS